MNQTLYKTAKPKPDDEFMLRTAERDKQFVVTQIRYHFDSKSGIDESHLVVIPLPVECLRWI
jgi:hypothetical protein